MIKNLMITFFAVFAASAQAHPSKCDHTHNSNGTITWHCFNSGLGDSSTSDRGGEVSTSHLHHAKHNMILLGTQEVFASHIVYKVPHNYQVILQVTFDEEVKKEYLAAKSNYPQDQIILLLNEMDISKIQETENLSGVLLRKDSSEQQTIINPHVTLNKGSFKVLFFDEVPLVLGTSIVPSTNHLGNVIDARDSDPIECRMQHWKDLKCLVCTWKDGKTTKSCKEF